MWLGLSLVAALLGLTGVRWPWGTDADRDDEPYPVAAHGRRAREHDRPREQAAGALHGGREAVGASGPARGRHRGVPRGDQRSSRRMALRRMAPGGDGGPRGRLVAGRLDGARIAEAPHRRDSGTRRGVRRAVARQEPVRHHLQRHLHGRRGVLHAEHARGAARAVRFPVSATQPAARLARLRAARRPALQRGAGDRRRRGD